MIGRRKASKTHKLSTYNPIKEYTGSHFFILTKGINCGKTLENPYPNCFVCEYHDEEERN